MPAPMPTLSTILAQASDPTGGLTSFLPLIIIFAIMYFLLIRPQQQKEKERRLVRGRWDSDHCCFDCCA